ncbi:MULTISPECIES: HlyD family secretion protein [Halocynthiibacter]|uniref:HlyD family secretion protein n=1 Tax=Halocynthiibacter halioticoli TaxID=2986804 RepID=A0AAE3J2W6_9RHOB|nr:MULTISPECIES: HlyD family secretion protein [Halocynthiibacter]MCV6825891.1 HlyD family secretion protein [Halocynthiibacter halioticoli]MCW4058892.1 HlyD family secretion protein [Halocynthiibacter sp. SDUM655004]
MKHTLFDQVRAEPTVPKRQIRFPHLGVCASLVAVIVAAAWVNFALNNSHLKTVGYIETASVDHAIQSPSTAIISQVFVREGEEVKRGQILAQLAAPDLHLQAKLNKIELEEVTSTLSLLESLSGTQSNSRYITLAARMREERRSKARQHDIQVEQIISEKGSIQKQIQAISAQQEHLEYELSAQEQLEKRGLARQTRTQALKREYARLSGELAKLNGLLLANMNGLRLAKASYELTTLKSEIDVETQMQALRFKRSSLVAKSEDLSRQIDQLSLRAPASGIAHSINTKGSEELAALGEPILSIASEIGARFVTTLVPPIDAQSLSIGQVATLLLPANLTTGSARIQAEITYISPRPISLENGSTVYKVKLSPKISDKERLAGSLQSLLPSLPITVSFDEAPSGHSWQPFQRFWP